MPGFHHEAIFPLLHLSVRGKSDDNRSLRKDTVSSGMLLHYLSTGDFESFEARNDLDSMPVIQWMSTEATQLQSKLAPRENGMEILKG